MPSLDIRPDHLHIVRGILQTHVPNREVWAFGSRAKWTARETSDLDLCVQGDEPLSFESMGLLRAAFEESDLPYKVDVVDWATTSDAFRKIIERDKVAVQTARRAARSTWRTMAIEDCMAAIIDYRGKTPTKTTSGIPLITAKIVKGGRFTEPDEFIAEDAYEQWMTRGIPMKGDIVLTTEAPLGEVAQLDGRKVALAQRIITLRGKPGLLDNTYLKFVLQSHLVQARLSGRASGSTVSGIKQSELRKVELPIPSWHEQRAIAHILGTLDDKIELNRRINQTLEAMAKAIFKSWFVDFDPVKAKITAQAEDCDPLRAAIRAISGKTDAELEALPREHYGQLAATAALFPDEMEESELGEVPMGWSKKPLSQMIELIGGGTPKRSEPSYWDGNIPWFSVKDAPKDGDVFVIDTDEKITDFGLIKSSTKLLPIGATIISARGTVGKLALVGVPMAMNQSCYGVIGTDGCGAYFNYFNLSYAVISLKQNTHGAVFDTITQSTFETVYCIDGESQIKLAFEKTVKPLLLSIKSHLFEIRSLEQARDTLLPKLLSGELLVSTAENFIPEGDAE